jgi:hypothetical protein
MVSLSVPRASFKNDFSAMTESFLHTPGLPFASVLDAEAIERVFHEEEALFGQADLFSTQLVLWAFLAQTLRDGKGVACSSAVADIAAYLLQTGQRPPCGDTGDYCRAVRADARDPHVARGEVPGNDSRLSNQNDHDRHDPDRPEGLFTRGPGGTLRLPLECRTGHSPDQTDAASGPRTLQEPRDGPAGVVGDPPGLQSDSQGHGHLGTGPP